MNQEASFTFTTPLNVNVVEIKGEEHLFVEGDISTNDIDLVNDIMTVNCQKSMQKQILERTMKLDLEHEAFRGETAEEKEINKTRIPAGKLVDAVVKDLGNDRYSTRVKGEINRHNPRYKEIKGNLLEGYLDAFSVAFLPTDISYEKKDGKAIRMLNDVRLLNIALTGNPCNTKAQLVDVFMKSMDAVEEYKKLKELDPTIESKLVVKDNSHSQVGDDLDNKQLNLKNNSKMTDNKDGNGIDTKDFKNVEAEQKAMQSEFKALNEKYDAIVKDNVSLKESMVEISKELKKITEALNTPIHKSTGVQKTDAEAKSVQRKSVDPLELF